SRSAQPRPAAADHEHVHAPVLGVEARDATAVLVDPPEPRDVPQELLVVRPEAARPDHRPVVEADGSERPSEAVHDGEEVALQRTEDVLRLDAGTVPDRLDADAYVGCSVDGHHAIGAAARAAQQAAGPVVLEAA